MAPAATSKASRLRAGCTGSGRHVKFVAAFAIAVLVWGAGMALAGELVQSPVQAGAVKKVSIATGIGSVTSSFNWVDVPGASIPIQVGTHPAYLDARFAATSMCKNNVDCLVRILVNGVAMDPGFYNIFDSAVVGAASDYVPGSHSIERSSRLLAAGTYTVTVQYAAGESVNGLATSFELDDWQLTVDEVAS
jgi:hypothetical protein